MPAESVHLKWKSTVLESKTKGIAVNLTTMPILKNLFITISTTLIGATFFIWIEAYTKKHSSILRCLLLNALA